MPVLSSSCGTSPKTSKSQSRPESTRPTTKERLAKTGPAAVKPKPSKTTVAFKTPAAPKQVTTLPRRSDASKRKDRALTRIEYHRSLYRFFRTYRGVSSASLVFAIRFIKAFFYVLTRVPLALLGGSYRADWIDYRDVLTWHLRGCPAAVGLGQFIEFEPAEEPVASSDPASPLFRSEASRGRHARA